MRAILYVPLLAHMSRARFQYSRTHTYSQRHLGLLLPLLRASGRRSGKPWRPPRAPGRRRARRWHSRRHRHQAAGDAARHAADPVRLLTPSFSLQPLPFEKSPFLKAPADDSADSASADLAQRVGK